MMKRMRTLLLSFLLLAILPVSVSASGFTKETEEDLYQTILAGLQNGAGGVYDDAAKTMEPGAVPIDISRFGYSRTNSQETGFVYSVFRRALYDHPEFLFLREGVYKRGKGDSYQKLIPLLYDTDSFYGDGKDRSIYQAEAEAAIKEAVSMALEADEPVERLLILYDWLAARNCYNWELGVAQKFDLPRAPYNNSPARGAYSALVRGDTVCKGLATAYKLLVDRLGDPRLECLIIYNLEGSHVWNLVSIDGTWYHVDVNAAINRFPTTPGLHGHALFLATTAQTKGAQGWTTAGTVPWSEQPACTGKTYASGWAFNDNSFPLHHYHGSFLYLRDGGLYQGGLHEQGTKIADIDPAGGTGICWHDGSLYYVDRDGSSWTLFSYSVDKMEKTALGEIPFTASASPDGRYPANYDSIGLRYDQLTGTVKAVSRTTRETLFQTAVDSTGPTFLDVPSSAYYAEAVRWALERDITSGTSKNLFSPDLALTRAQAVTFLWRAMGSPAPASESLRFSDVDTGKYYSDAVIWAAEKGIATGTSQTLFSPDMTLSRAQMITFLWRAMGRPNDSGSRIWYEDAVDWANEQGLLQGTADGFTAEGHNVCPRCDTVYYMWKALC